MKKNLIYCAIAMVASVFTACNKESFKEPAQGEGRVFTASFADTKAASATGVVTFKAGETIDLWYMDGETAKSETITLTAENITNAGKSVVFNSTITADKIMAVYPGYVSGSTRGNNWQTAPATASLPGAKGPRFNLTSATEGVSSGFVTGGSTSFTLKNQLAIISFSADETMSGFAYLYDNRYLADANAKNIYIQALINWETGEAVGVNPQGYVATNKLTDKDDMRFVVVPTFSLPEGFTIKAGASLSTATEVVKTEKAFTANANQFLRIGNINKKFSIDITIGEVTYDSAEVTFKPTSKEADYVAMSVDKEYFDKFTSDEEIVADDVEFFEILAQHYGVDIEKVLDVYVISGDNSEEYVDLDPETEYVAYAYGFSRADLTATSAVFKEEYKTPAAPSMPEYEAWLGNWTIKADGGFKMPVRLEQGVYGKSFLLYGAEGMDEDDFAIVVDWDQATDKISIETQKLAYSEEYQGELLELSVYGQISMSGKVYYVKGDYPLCEGTKSAGEVITLTPEKVTITGGQEFDIVGFKYYLIGDTSGKAYGVSSTNTPLPSTLERPGDASEAYKAWLGDWTVNSENGAFTITIAQDVPDASFQIYHWQMSYDWIAPISGKFNEADGTMSIVINPSVAVATNVNIGKEENYNFYFFGEVMLNDKQTRINSKNGYSVATCALEGDTVTMTGDQVTLSGGAAYDFVTFEIFAFPMSAGGPSGDAYTLKSACSNFPVTWTKGAAATSSLKKTGNSSEKTVNGIIAIEDCSKAFEVARPAAKGVKTAVKSFDAKFNKLQKAVVK